MRALAVSGACSRAGKTALAETLLRALPPGRALAIKFTTTDDEFERCPRGTDCVVCGIDVPYRLITDPRVLDEAGTDTARLGAAGASRVLWAIAKRGAVARAWDAVRAAAGDALAVLEGSSIALHERPALALFVAHPFLQPSRWKDTSEPLVRSADLVVVNRPANEAREPAPEVLARLRSWRGRDDLRVADVTEPLAAWAPELAARLKVEAA